MQFDEGREGGVLVISVSGRLDAETATDLQTAVLSRVDSGEASIVLDLEGLEYVSSAGLRVVLMAAKRLQQAGGSLVVCSLQDTVLEVFRVSGMDSIIKTASDRAGAMKALA
jgi:anti-anti-sigma factor